MRKLIAFLLLLAGATSATAQTPPYVFPITLSTSSVQILPVNPLRKRVERRDERAVRSQKRVSKELLKIAKPLLFADLGRSGGKARAASISATLASKIGRKAGRARMRQLTREQRSEFARAAALSRWNRHRAAAKAASASDGASA